MKCGWFEASPNSLREGLKGKPGRNKNKRAGRRYPKYVKFRRRAALQPGMKVKGPYDKRYVVDKHGALRRVAEHNQ
jgi:hypothetical protein